MEPPLARLLMLELAPPLAEGMEFINETREPFPLPHAASTKQTTEPQPKGFKMLKNILDS